MPLMNVAADRHGTELSNRPVNPDAREAPFPCSPSRSRAGYWER